MNRIISIILISLLEFSCINIKEEKQEKEKKIILKTIDSPCDISMELYSKDSIKVEINKKILIENYYKSKTDNTVSDLHKFYVKDSLIFIFCLDKNDPYIVNQNYQIDCEESNIIHLYK